MENQLKNVKISDEKSRKMIEEISEKETGITLGCFWGHLKKTG